LDEVKKKLEQFVKEGKEKNCWRERWKNIKDRRKGREELKREKMDWGEQVQKCNSFFLYV